MKPKITDDHNHHLPQFKTLAALGAFGLSLAAAYGQSISHTSTTRMNLNRDTAGASDQFRISVKAGSASYVAAADGTLSATGPIGDGTLLDWQIFTAVNNTPFTGATVSAGSGGYLDTATCADTTAGGPQEWFDVWTTGDILVDPADIGTGLTPAVGNGPTPLTGNVDISGLQSGKFYIMHGNFAQSARVNMTMSGPGQSPIVLPTYLSENPGSQNRMWLMEFTFENPNGNYYNIHWTVDNNQNNTGRRRAGGIFLDGTLYVDTVEPAWVATYPNANPVGDVLFFLNGQLNEDGTIHYVVLADGAPAPSSAQVKAGTDASNTPVALSGDFAVEALVAGSEVVSGLTASTSYDVYVVAEDVRGPNLQATPVLIDVTTTAPDVTPPAWTASYPQLSRTPAGLSGIANINEAGQAYFVVLASGASAPSSAQVKAGTDASDSPAPSGTISGLLGGVSGSAVVGGLTVGTTYDVYFVAEDLGSNLQASPQLVTSAPVAPVTQFATGGFTWGSASVWSVTTGGPYNGPWGPGNNAVFEGTVGVVPVASGTIVNDMTFSGSFILQGGPLTLAGTTQPVITATAGIPKIEASLAGTQGFTKTGVGTLQITGPNSITGGIVINGGSLNTETGATALNNNDITANTGAVGLTLASGTTTNGGITINAATLSISNNNGSITVNGPVTGTGGITLNKTGDGQNLVSLLSTGNTFTGGVDYTGNRSLELNVNSFVDSAAPGAGKIRFGLGTPSDIGRRNRFALQSGAIAPVTLTNRQFEIASTGSDYPAQIYNNSAQAFTINSELIVSGTGAKTLELGGDGAGANAFTGKIVNGSATLALTKSGSGTWALSGENTYTGTTTVSGGTLLINGNQSTATGAVAVNGTGTLGGSGTIGGTVTVAATAKLAPGTSVGTLAIGGDLNISAMAGGAGTLNYELATIAASDKITVGGGLNIGSGTLGFSDFVFTNVGGLQAGTYTLITSSALTGTLNELDLVGSIGTFDGTLQISGNNIVLALVAGNPTTTLVIDLGAGTVIEGGAFGTFGATNLPLPALPVGSILRSVSVDAAITATDNENYASDLAILFDPTPGTPGGDFSLRMTSGAITFGATNQLTWSGGASGPPATLVDTKNAADWGAVGPIDLATYGIFLGNAYQDAGWVAGQGGTWSGTITLTYDLVSTGSPYTTWATTNAPTTGDDPSADEDGDGVSNGVEFVVGGTIASNDLDKLPVAATSGGNLTFSFERDQDSIDASVAVSIEVGTDLATWPDEYAVPDTASAGPPVAVVDNADGTDTVTLTVAQAPDAKKFARLKVVITP